MGNLREILVENLGKCKGNLGEIFGEILGKSLGILGESLWKSWGNRQNYSLLEQPVDVLINKLIKISIIDINIKC